MTALRVGAHTFSYSFTRTALDAMLHLAGLGFDAFEVLVTAPHCWPAELDARTRRAVRSRLDSDGLGITSLCFPSIDNNLISTAADMRRETKDVIHRVIDLAADWRVPNVLVIPGRLSPLWPAPYEWTLAWFLDAMREFLDHAGDDGPALIVENVPVTFLPRVRDIMTALDALGDDRVGILYDAANGVFMGDDPASDLGLVKDRLRLVHLSDTTREVYRHDPVGAGVVPFAAVAETLREIGYDGFSILEMVVKDDPERAFVESDRRLAEWGWKRAAEADRG